MISIAERLTKRLMLPAAELLPLLQTIGEINVLNNEFRRSEQLTPQTLGRLSRSILVTSAGASNRIEGNQLTDEQVDQLYQNKRIQKFRTRDEQEVVGYLEVLELIFSSFDHMIFSEGLILQLHQQMLEHSDKDSGQRGKYKFGPNRVEARDETGTLIKVIFDPTEPRLTPHEMRELITRTQEQLRQSIFPPLLVIANFVFEFLAIHPFQDGNGRLSRLLTQLLMLQQGYGFTAYASHESVIESEKIAYYQALNKTQVSRKTDSENMIPWLDFFLGVIRQQGLKAISIGTQNQIEAYLSPRQLNIRRLLQSERQATRKRLSEQSGIPYDTVGQILQKLVKMGKIEKRGSTRGTVYQLIG